MSGTGKDQIVALAGIFQAATLAQQLARRGYEDEAAFAASVRSVFITDAINTESVFGGVEGVRLGLSSMLERLSTHGKPSDLEIARYVLGLTQLGVKLGKNQAMAQRVSTEIDNLKAGSSFNNGGGPGNHAYIEMARIYKETISYLKPKIIVQGEHGYLSNEVVIDKVRAILLAGVRAAYLWHQVGGRRWHLLVRRKQLLEGARVIVTGLDEE